MKLEICLSEDTVTNTRYAPLAVLGAVYQATGRLAPLRAGGLGQTRREFSVGDLLEQVLWSMLAGCETLSEVNGRLRGEQGLAAVGGWARFADQSTLSRGVDGLSQMQIEDVRAAVTTLMQLYSPVRQHDWRGYLWLDFDVSGLPCSARAEASQKGYFSGEKTPQGANWRG